MPIWGQSVWNSVWHQQLPWTLHHLGSCHSLSVSLPQLVRPKTSPPPAHTAGLSFLGDFIWKYLTIPTFFFFLRKWHFSNWIIQLVKPRNQTTFGGSYNSKNNSVCVCFPYEHSKRSFSVSANHFKRNSQSRGHCKNEKALSTILKVWISLQPHCLKFITLIVMTTSEVLASDKQLCQMS